MKPGSAGTRLSLSAYRPRVDDRHRLEEHLRQEIAALRSRGHITERPVPICRTEAGEYLVVLEWSTTTAVDDAHADAAILAIWERKAELFEYVGVSELARASVPFAAYDVAMDA